MRSNPKKSKKKIIIILAIIFILAIVGILIFKNISSKNPKKVNNKEQTKSEEKIEEGQNELQEKIDIIDVNSKTRPYAVVVNNTPVAVKVQEGLNKAYIVYEIPTEGNTSRLLALYKDVDESLVVGTIRSARHNFIDFSLESDAIFCCFGWSHYAENDLKTGIIDYLQGLHGGPFYRNNPENLASEHTAYTTIGKLNESVKIEGIRNTTEEDTLLNYHVSDIDLSIISESKITNKITIPYGFAPNVAAFEYNLETKMYSRYENGNKCIDHNTGEEITTKNIIVQKIKYEKSDDNYYWDLETIGSGEGYYITNGHSIPIEWKKENRSDQTKYTYKAGTVIDGEDVGGKEISVSDGRTWIEVQTTSQNLTIE